MDAFYGEIRLLPYSFVPQNFLPCDGRSLLIQQYSVLFTVIGNRFGGDGKTTFMLPNLNGRVVMGAGQGTGLPNAAFASTAGADKVALNSLNYPPHNHGFTARDGTEPDQRVDIPSTTTYLAQPRNINLYNTVGTTQTLAEGSMTDAGTGNGNIERNLMQPYLALAYCICVEGEYPIRND
ncbi:MULTISPECIES: phage tail protein [Pseudomonas]|jgi:microcystin-dependent protein|uniref:phage tail protein n=1 Tax=Pseudomonas TaxID=286 RepID=UPI000E25AD20|nr:MULTISPECIES: tail fiber protein [Pseudomonas]MEC6742900.1 tail fiber protein [Pseudomonas qingdaonensis]WKL64978.1 tail fiber protein [Pseudomonas qingdaonensis]